MLCFTMSRLVVQGRASCLAVCTVIRVNIWLFVSLGFLITFSETVQASQPYVIRKHTTTIYSLSLRRVPMSGESKTCLSCPHLELLMHIHSHSSVDIEALLCVGCDQGPQVLEFAHIVQGFILSAHSRSIFLLIPRSGKSTQSLFNNKLVKPEGNRIIIHTILIFNHNSTENKI